ncbi:MAG TPA: DNA-3-methyladenine glycosylase [Streptosporangiaceae bacterium]|nr:DNA-3-methyladenine glycosylase [Streptosporangiaceae bacterium]
MPDDTRPGGDAGAVLPREFFDGHAPEVAPLLLGCVLRRDSPQGPVAAVITEVEAYAGLTDPASHAYRGETARNAVMFGPPGHAYVYFTYGMHFCVNLVCEPAGAVSAILLRAGRIIEGAGLAAARRWPQADGEAGAGGRAGTRTRRHLERDLARGPARLCQALGIDMALNGADAVGLQSPLRVSAGPDGPVPADMICSGPRIGISQAVDVPWRFWLAGDTHVSQYRTFTPRRSRS